MENHMEFDDDTEREIRREAFLAAGEWKPIVVGLTGVALLVASVVTPRHDAVYLNWLVGLIATNVAVLMSGNRVWERPVAAGAALWLFMSGFVQSLYQSSAWMRSDLVVAALLIIAAVSALIHLRQDLRAHRPMAL
jgi:hypothetical protein